MSKETLTRLVVSTWALALTWPVTSLAQVPVDDQGSPVVASSVADDEIPLLSAAELESLVGPIALYPDDLLAIVLPASTYPLQLVQAERFLQDLKVDPDLEPDESWDDSIVALLNYPEAIELMTRDLDKTWRLGEAVVAQQADVIAAIESFRDQAYAAGNLQSDEKQTVAQNDGVIEITPVEEDVIYVPYYEPEEVVVYQPRPVYYYYPRAYPVYYYPYPYGYSFSHGFFWGVTTAFTVGWFSDSLHVYHHSYYGHPFYGRYYGYNYWYRRPSIHVHNNYYYSHNNYVNHRYGHGDYWRPHSRSTVSHHDQRVTRSRHYPGSGTTHDRATESDRPRSRSGRPAQASQRRVADSKGASQQIKFRQRTATTSNQSSSISPNRSRSGQLRASSKQQSAIEFKERPAQSASRFAANTAGKQQAGRPSSRSVKPHSAQPGLSKPSKSSQARLAEPSRSGDALRPSTQSRRSVAPPSRSDAPSVNQPNRSSKPARSSQPSRSHQPARSNSPTRPANTQRSSSGKQQQSKNSAIGKVARSENAAKNRGSNRRR